MDALELLKKDWKKQESSFPQIKTDALYKMIHQRSSSLTKWILIIAIIEFIFWVGINVVTSTKESIENLKQLHFYKINIVLTIVNFSIILYFIYRFFINYKHIQTTDNTRQLMRKILKVRRTVNYYVIYNLTFLFVSAIMVMTAMYFYDPRVKELLEISESGHGRITSWGLILLSTGFIILLITVFWLFYKLLYGILMRRLKRNYKELNKLELND
ncbi:hypothetical protein [Flavimarina sp. Hel_I_48]|uniref:hypothetical protein n=1 Tax=Flavimarina sp. Hel_I_48 TaxID=1392488 RepID=UPI0004DF9AF8|nr:hypothetical protein [Flavimarina sp. Hel_I_48]